MARAKNTSAGDQEGFVPNPISKSSQTLAPRIWDTPAQAFDKEYMLRYTNAFILINKQVKDMKN